MKLSYDQFIELCKSSVFTFGYLTDNMILWYDSCNYGTIWIITHCNWSCRGHTTPYTNLLPHILKIYIEREFRGEVWEVEFNKNEVMN
jgi:hypothetical protein